MRAVAEPTRTKPTRHVNIAPGTGAAPILGAPPRRRTTPSADVTPAPFDGTLLGASEGPQHPPMSDESHSSETGDPADRKSRVEDHNDPFLDDVGLLGIGGRAYPANHDEPPLEPLDAPTYADDPSVEARIRDIEARLDGLLSSAPEAPLDEPMERPSSLSQPASADEAVDAARELLESSYYRRKWGRASLRERGSEMDDFGLDRAVEEKLRPLLDFLYKVYFRVQVEGADHVPPEGRAIVVANHSGSLPFDGVMLREAMRHKQGGARDLRWLAEDFSFYLPFIGVAMNRIGAVRACPENAERLLSRDHIIGVFPEGAEGTKKLFRERYKLKRFGRGGFVRLALKTQSPIVPSAIIGAEESYPMLYRFDNLARLIGLEYLPVTPTFPLLGPLGLVPAPSKWRIVFGEPISVSEYGPGAHADDVLVGRLSERVRTRVAELIDSGLGKRRSAWF